MDNPGLNNGGKSNPSKDESKAFEDTLLTASSMEVKMEIWLPRLDRYMKSIAESLATMAKNCGK